MRVLMLSPEPPYPLHSGGAYRTASLLHYFAQYAEVDLLLISESGEPSPLPSGLVRSQQVITLPIHRKDLSSRYWRNAQRAVAGIPPLIDRLSGLDSRIADAIGQRHYDLAIVEHFWCAPYVKILAGVSAKTVLNLHNVESVLHERCAAFSGGLVKLGHVRFAAASRRLEAALLPLYSLVLATSEADAELVQAIAPGATVGVFPNSFPITSPPDLTEGKELNKIVFAANFEYHPNIDAVQFLVREIWPEVRRRHPHLVLRLVGRGDQAIRQLLPENPGAHGIQTTGAIPHALPEIARACIVVAPLRAGSGTRIKILEAWAASRPVIATPLAAEGLNVVDGENIVLAADAPAFAEAIDSLLASESARRRIGANGHRTLQDFYSWPAAWAKLDLNPQLMRLLGLKRYTGNS